jgi:glycerol-3-phosphate dehydrogenase
VINAAGVWVDQLRQQDGAAIGREVKPMVAPSQGVHVVVDREFLPGRHALMVPKTADGRVLFGVPWLGKVILGTTDTPRTTWRASRGRSRRSCGSSWRGGRYLVRPPRLQDARSIWVGLRPLVKPQDDEGGNTKALSREHTVLVSRSGLVTVTGGKWTTYRAMAEDVLERCFEAGLLGKRSRGVTADLPLVGADPGVTVRHPLSDPPGLHLYGSEAAVVQLCPGPNRTGWRPDRGHGAVRGPPRIRAHRRGRAGARSRLLFLDAALARQLGSVVGRILRQETGVDRGEGDFATLAASYRPERHAT